VSAISFDAVIMQFRHSLLTSLLLISLALLRVQLRDPPTAILIPSTKQAWYLANPGEPTTQLEKFCSQFNTSYTRSVFLLGTSFVRNMDQAVYDRWVSHIQQQITLPTGVQIVVRCENPDFLARCFARMIKSTRSENSTKVRSKFENAVKLA
jgi:hypothetical protein